VSEQCVIIRSVPDNDFIPRGVRPAWRKAAELALGLHESVQLTDACAKALAAEIRAADFGAQLARLVADLQAAAFAGDYALLRSAEANFREAASSVPLTTAVIDECERLFELRSFGLSTESLGGIHARLMEGALRHHASSALFGPQEMLIRMHRQATATYEDVDAYRAGVLNALPTDHFSRALFENPDRPVRAPTATARASTADMLGERVR
jgi:hypothetical protein